MFLFHFHIHSPNESTRTLTNELTNAWTLLAHTNDVISRVVPNAQNNIPISWL